jgi:2-amino-4-hydroxy-6-hydroxymethyldihydropteridine diphosphokinase
LNQQLYLIALGSNQRLAHIGGPADIVEQSFAALETHDIDVFAASSIIASRPMGPSKRCYANAAAVVATQLDPPALLDRLQEIEAHFGRTRRGQPWQARTLDLDIILWSGGIWASEAPALAIPHRQLRNRAFVLSPANEIAPDWRDPLNGLSIAQIFHRFNRAKPLDHANKHL